jgi:hypothetical protein
MTRTSKVWDLAKKKPRSVVEMIGEGVSEILDATSFATRRGGVPLRGISN